MNDKTEKPSGGLLDKIASFFVEESADPPPEQKPPPVKVKTGPTPVPGRTLQSSSASSTPLSNVAGQHPDKEVRMLLEQRLAKDGKVPLFVRIQRVYARMATHSAIEQERVRLTVDAITADGSVETTQLVTELQQAEKILSEELQQKRAKIESELTISETVLRNEIETVTQRMAEIQAQRARLDQEAQILEQTRVEKTTAFEKRCGEDRALIARLEATVSQMRNEISGFIRAIETIIHGGAQ